MPGANFDRVADHYDASRGGQRRGDRFAEAIAPWVTGERVVELGVGTGVVAVGLRRLGHRVVGFDLSADMMRTAFARVGPTVARADVDVLPLADRSVDCAIFVWVLQLVDDVAVTLREAARVVRPGGRVIVVSADGESHPDDEIGKVMEGLRALGQPTRHAEVVVGAAPPELALEHHGATPWQEFEGSAADEIDLVQRRSYSSLFELEDEAWQAHVEPVLERLRALPDPDAKRWRCNRNPLIIWHVA